MSNLGCHHHQKKQSKTTKNFDNILPLEYSRINNYTNLSMASISQILPAFYTELWNPICKEKQQPTVNWPDISYNNIFEINTVQKKKKNKPEEILTLI